MPLPSNVQLALDAAEMRAGDAFNRFRDTVMLAFGQLRSDLMDAWVPPPVLDNSRELDKAEAEPTASVAEGAPAALTAAEMLTFDPFNGQEVPRLSRITIVTDNHWRGELGESSFEGAPDAVAASLRQAARDAASFLKS